MEKYRVLLVDDEPLLLESLEILLTYGGMEVVAMSRDGKEALEALTEHPADIALVDLNMKGMGGIELISCMRQQYPSVKILVLTTFYDDEYITAAIANGADGYLLKDSGKNAIIDAICQIMEGRTIIDSKVMERLALLMAGKRTEGKGQEMDTAMKLPETMTEREQEVCTLLTRGFTNRQIADALFISEGTVKNYISSIYEKTGIHDRAKLIVALKG
ncbi:MAG: response regulator transcription factor [Lachnospiraceae bacterium]|nr:response regulator transcription factor [Lachnospiraceae bacterium]